MKNTAVIFTLVILVAVLVMVWFFTSPKKSPSDRYNALGNDGVVQRATGKDYPYGPVHEGAGQYDTIPNSINYEKSDMTMPANWLARRKAISLGSGY